MEKPEKAYRSAPTKAVWGVLTKRRMKAYEVKAAIENFKTRSGVIKYGKNSFGKGIVSQKNGLPKR